MSDIDASFVQLQPTVQVFVRNLDDSYKTIEIFPTADVSCAECYEERPPPTDHYKMVKCLQHQNNWDFTFTVWLVEEYVRFLELKCSMKDWKCKKIFPSPLIDQV